MVSDLTAALREMLSTRVTFPSPAYRDDPERFAREILGVELWSRQAEILRTVRDHDRVAVKSGRRVSKSHTVAILALWFYCSFPDARVVLSSTTARQVDEVLWRELTMILARSGRCVDCKRDDPNGTRIPTPCDHSSVVEGKLGLLARSGFKSRDFRQIVGFTARDQVAMQGIAGSKLMYIVDEASGIPQAIFDAIEGNRAGGAKVVLMGNPTRNDGEFYDASHGKKRDLTRPDSTGYVSLTISSEESPNVVAGKELIPGLATREYIREREIEWGRESPLFKVHVSGLHAEGEDGAIFTIHAIEESQRLWEETPEKGRLYLGLDPAGASGTGDESVFVLRRGLKMLSIVAKRGLNDDGHIVEVVGALKGARLPREVPVVVIDREGPIGSSLYGALRQHAEAHQGSFIVVPLRASDRAVRQPRIYDRMRDELAANLEGWFRDGGAILEDAHLAKELHEMRWEQLANGRLKLIEKKKIKKQLGRSPDRYDALALSTWEPLMLREEEPDEGTPDAPARSRQRADDDEPMDPYGGRAFDPYGGGLR
ncbi:MAG TPA: hypothetical protein VLT45_07875 [Kofleriaceae bacterium]|nr:hypothetical protein [Kofleriaceae bacterium]